MTTQVMLLYSQDGVELLSVFDYDRRDEFKDIATDIGGLVRGPLMLNEVYADRIKLDGKRYFWVTMLKAGNVHITEDSVLTSDGNRKPEKYFLETYSKNRQKFKKKAHWRLFVRCYAKSENDAKAIANRVRTAIENDPELGKGQKWRYLATGEEVD